VTSKGPRWRKLAKLVAHHVLSDIDGDKLVAIVNRQCVPDKVRSDCRSPGPRTNDLLISCFVQGFDLQCEMLVNEGPLLNRPWHVLSYRP